MIKISSISQLASQRIPDRELVMISSQFEGPQESFAETVKTTEVQVSIGGADALSNSAACVIQEGDPLPASLFADLCTIPLILLRPPRESDLFVLSTEMARSMGEEECGLQQLNNELLSLAGSEKLCHSCILSAPFCSKNLPELGPGEPLGDAVMIEDLLMQSFETENISLSESDFRCMSSGILLLWNLLDESHSISQSMEGEGRPRTADCWHGIMHRREPDPGNAAYWFRRVGSHPAYDSLMTHLRKWLVEQKTSDAEMQILEAELLKGRRWDPFRMIELCQQALRQPDSTLDTALRRVQYLEILNLLAFTYNEQVCE